VTAREGRAIGETRAVSANCARYSSIISFSLPRSHARSRVNNGAKTRQGRFTLGGKSSRRFRVRARVLACRACLRLFVSLALAVGKKPLKRGETREISLRIPRETARDRSMSRDRWVVRFLARDGSLCTLSFSQACSFFSPAYGNLVEAFIFRLRIYAGRLRVEREAGVSLCSVQERSAARAEARLAKSTPKLPAHRRTRGGVPV